MMGNQQTYLFFSSQRLWTIGRNTMTEMIRQKFFYILLIFGVIVLMSAGYFSQFSVEEIDRTKFIKDFGLAAITIFGVLIAIVGAAQLLPLELENRTIYPILAKPVFRIEFLMGKYLGMITLLLLTTIMMGTMLGGLIFYTERQLVADALNETARLPGVNPQEVITQILKQTRDPSLFKAVALIYCKMIIISAIALLVSTFATSVIFNVITSTMIYVGGHLEASAQSVLGDNPFSLTKLPFLIITFLIPDLNAFDVADAVVLGQSLPMIDVIKTIEYGVLYSAVVLWITYMIFRKKEI